MILFAINNQKDGVYGMGFFSKSIIGIELDSQELRAVELRGTVKKPVVSAWGRVKLPDGIVKESRIANTKLFGASLERLIKENGFKSKDIILGVNNQDVIVRFASFPKVPEDNIRSMIRFQAQDYIPVSLEELELDYVVVSDKKTEEGEFINVVLVAARKKMLNDFIEALTNANTSIKEIDSTMLAIGRAALIGNPNGTFVIACFNHDIGNILIFREGELVIARSVNFSQWPSWSEYKTGEAQDHVNNVIADILFSEIKSSVSYYMMQSGEAIETLYLLGCGAQQNQVAARLRELTGLAVSIPAPYTNLENHTGKSKSGSFRSSDYTACISLALRGLS